MRFFFFMILQVLLFLPLTSLAAEGVMSPALQNQSKTEISEVQTADVRTNYGKLPLYFIENKGQVDGQVSFYERGAGHATFFTPDGVVLSLTKKERNTEKLSFKNDILGLKTKQSAAATTEAVTLSFVGSNKKAAITSSETMPGHVNYFVGNDKSKWRSNIPTYGAITYKDVYKNIDMKFYGNNKNIEHDVIVHPGGDFSEVIFAYKGVQGLKVTETGDLEVGLKEGNLSAQKPVIYQEINGERVAVDGSYRILKGADGAFTYGFNVASYDHSKDLVIDPVLEYSTYLGGSGDDWGYALALDSTGAAYVSGNTTSIDFPVMSLLQASISGFGDAFITKINSAGTAIIYSTYLGGSGGELAIGIAVDDTGAAYLTGDTDSVDFPLLNPIQAAVGGGLDAFITKINPAGSAIVYSTYLGGGSDDVGKGIALDSTGAAYIMGYTASVNFPVSSAVQVAHAGGIWDAFITKINAAGTAYVYSTYLGGGSDDYGEGIAVDGFGAAYVTGWTLSTNFPVVSALQGVTGGFIDAFITKINSAGTAYVYSTYLGGTGSDIARAIALDGAGAAYVTGDTSSTDFPLVSPIQAVYGGGSDDAFVTKISQAGTAPVYSTYMGGSFNDTGIAIAIDSAGAAYLTGRTSSVDFPLLGSVQAANGGGLADAFVTKINPAGTAYAYSTYFGGNGTDYGYGIALDSVGAAYITGLTISTNLPLITPIQGGYGGGLWGDAFIAKLSDITVPPPVVTLVITPDVVSITRGSTLGYTVTATNTTAGTRCFDYWENVTLPSGGAYPPVGALFGPVHLCLAAGASQSVHLTHGVPMVAPLGAYIFNAFVGTNPTPVTSEDHFNFDVTAFGPITNTPQTSWRLLENGFRQ